MEERQLQPGHSYRCRAGGRQGKNQPVESLQARKSLIESFRLKIPNPALDTERGFFVPFAFSRSFFNGPTGNALHLTAEQAGL